MEAFFNSAGGCRCWVRYNDLMIDRKIPIDYATPNLPVPRKNYLVITLAGIILLVVGWPFLRRAYHGHDDAFPTQLESLLFLGPIMFALGGIMLLIGVFRFLAGFGWVQQIFTPSVGRWLRMVWRVSIWLAAAFTVWPFWWMDILASMKGQRPGNEGEGMAGTLIMIFIGLPALAVGILTEMRVHRNRRNGG